MELAVLMVDSDVDAIAALVRTMRAVMDDPTRTETQRLAKIRRLVLRLEGELFFLAATDIQPT